jgi:hypothetical protein
MTAKTFSFEINRTTSAHAATLFRLETDGARWSQWAKPLIVQSSWEQQGESEPAGVGAVRRVGMWRRSGHRFPPRTTAPNCC